MHIQVSINRCNYAQKIFIMFGAPLSWPDQCAIYAKRFDQLINSKLIIWRHIISNMFQPCQSPFSSPIHVRFSPRQMKVICMSKQV